MNRIVNFLQKYFAVISVLIGISILLSVTFSNYIVTSSNHKAAEMYIGVLKYSIEIDGTTTNTLIVPTGETIIDVKVNNLNPVDTYYKLLYLKNTNITVKYFETTKDTNEVVTTYNKPSDSITGSNSNTIKLLITNSSTSSQNIAFTMKGGYITNTIQDITTPSTYSEITLVETPSTNTYFCKTNDVLKQGLKYVNGQFTYAYKQEGQATNDVQWQDMTSDGWGVQLTDKSSTDAVTSKLCTYVNDKPITSLASMFRISAVSSTTGASSFDLSGFNTVNVTNMTNMFRATKATTLDISNLDTSNVTDMSYMFSSSKATSLNLNGIDTSNVTNMHAMFMSAYATTIDISSFDTSNVTDMGSMFSTSRATEIILGKINTANVTDMSGMFSNSYATTLDVSNLNTSKVTDMNRMFFSISLTTLDLSNFNTANVTNMEGMFSSCDAVTIDVSSFNTSKVTNMRSMFFYLKNLKTIYVSNKFVTTAVTDSTSMFERSTNLVGGSGTKYNSSKIDKTYARIDGGTSNPGYFTDINNQPSTFSTDDWTTIISSVKSGNTRGYKVGETKEVSLGTTYGTHTLRIANTSTPDACNNSGFSQTACGFVIEFTDIIEQHVMNPVGTYKGKYYKYGWNKDGWPATSMRTYVNSNIYNALPSALRNGIINTTVVSSYGSYDSSNFTSTDKLYLLSPGEVFTDWSSQYDKARSLTRTLDYYASKGTTTNSCNDAIKKKDTTPMSWFTRSAGYNNEDCFFGISYGCRYDFPNASSDYGVSPAFRIG